MTVVMKIKKPTFKHIESELYSYYDTLKEIDNIRKDIMFCKENIDENVGGGRSSVPSSPTEQIGTRLATHKRLNQLEEVANAISKVYTSLPFEYQRLMKIKYWDRPLLLTWDGIALELNVSKRTAYRMRDTIVFAIAEKLGWR